MAIDFSRSYTFSQIFDLQLPVEELIADFSSAGGGIYQYQLSTFDLPQSKLSRERLQTLSTQLQNFRLIVPIYSEQARREALIFPVLAEVALCGEARLSIEKPIKVTEQLQGYLDYLLLGKTSVIVIEAKRQDLAYGMTQLAAEMIALDQWSQMPDQPTLLGAISTGEVWQFATLDRQTKVFCQNTRVYAIPDALGAVVDALLYPLLAETAAPY